MCVCVCVLARVCVYVCVQSLGMTREEVAGQGFVILMAGYETTSTTLQYLTYNLALHQDVQQRVYEEIIDTIGDVRLIYHSSLSFSTLNH